MWLDQAGKRVPYATIEPGESLNQRTYDTNAWIVLDRAGTCIGYVVAPSRVYAIEGPAAVNVTVGGPGVVEGGGIECGGSLSRVLALRPEVAGAGDPARGSRAGRALRRLERRRV